MPRSALCVAFVTTLAGATLSAASWPQWRGPSLDGRATDTGLPTTWSATQNVAWKLPLPAYSGSTPIIWNNLVFLNVATGATTGHIELWAVDRDRQSVIWKRTLGNENYRGQKQNMSTPSPVTDGRHVWAMTGTGVIKAFTMAGEELWTRDIQREYGQFGIQFGYGSSPFLYDGALYVQVLHGFFTDDPSYVLRIDGLTGRTSWRVNRPTNAVRESPDSYTTPTVLTHNGQSHLIVTGGDAVTAHHLATGAEVWRADVLNPTRQGNYRIVASPVVVGDLVIAPTRVGPLAAIRAGGQGDVARSHVAWTFNRGPDVPTPVSDGTLLYLVSETGVVYCVDVKTGALVYGPVRLPNDFYSASPLLADGKIYVTGETTGITTVFRAGPRFEILASNTFGDPCSPYCLSSIAVSEGQFFVRTDAHLWVVGTRRR